MENFLCTSTGVYDRDRNMYLKSCRNSKNHEVKVTTRLIIRDFPFLYEHFVLLFNDRLNAILFGVVNKYYATLKFEIYNVRKQNLRCKM